MSDTLAVPRIGHGQTTQFYLPTIGKAKSGASGAKGRKIREMTAKDLLGERLPDPLTSSKSTKSRTVHAHLIFVGTLRRWDTFETDVVKEYRDTFAKGPGGVLDWVPADNEPEHNNCRNEATIVGDEHSLQGRFSDQALKQVTCVLVDESRNMRYGDAMTAGCQGQDNHLRLPDFAASKIGKEKEIELRVLGECKVFWTHDLRTWADPMGQPERRRSQTANYMMINKLKYGFITTHRETVFLKQVKRDDVPDPNNKGQVITSYVMYYSNPIHHDTVRDSSSAVTVRMGLWYLSRKGYELPNGGAPDIDKQKDWIGTNTDPDNPAVQQTNVTTRGQRGRAGASDNDASQSTYPPAGSSSAASHHGDPSDRAGRPPSRDRGTTGNQQRPTSRPPNKERKPHEDVPHRSKTAKDSTNTKSSKPQPTKTASATKPTSVIKIYPSRSEPKYYKSNAGDKYAVSKVTIRAANEGGSYYRGSDGRVIPVEIGRR
ncbi:Glycoside catalytic core protein [Rutstroemia sp. NJR-2017a WRK4]|nr:Glycoside catalytic core protein [Rutstroemia sp. NJR-2017a WRK4]